MAYTNIDDPSAYFHTQIFTGGGTFNDSHTNNAHSGDFQPDLIWAKDRVNAYNHDLVDSSRGPTVAFHPNTTAAEYTRTQANYDFTSFDSNGFTTGAPDFTNSFGGNTNPNGKVAWQWKANGGTTSSNTDGSITSTVQANTDAGFSIVTYTAPSGAGNFTAGHGLGVKPDMVITKSRGATGGWWVWHKDLAQPNYYIGLHSSGAQAFEANMWGAGFDTSTIGLNVTASAQASETYVAYAFAEKQGYSKFGKYVGNGNANGAFVYTGFKPAFVMWKQTNSARNWAMMDSARDPFNEVDQMVWADLSNAESTVTTDDVDFLSNGFKMRGAGATTNESGGSYIYMAFASSPFTTSSGIPTTAR